MKKFLIFCLIILLLAFLPLKSQSLYEIFSYKSNLDASFYVNKVLASNFNCTAIYHGNGAIISCKLNDCKKVDEALEEKYGVSVSFQGDENDFVLALNKLNAKVVSSENVGEEKIVCGYSNLLGCGVFIDGNTVNFQMALINNKIIIGTPLIFGSF